MGTGIIQMTVEQFTRANEGTYTVQINDGKAKTQSSLVLVGDGEDVFTATLLDKTVHKFGFNQFYLQWHFFIKYKNAKFKFFFFSHLSF